MVSFVDSYGDGTAKGLAVSSSLLQLPLSLAIRNATTEREWFAHTMGCMTRALEAQTRRE